MRHQPPPTPELGLSAQAYAVYTELEERAREAVDRRVLAFTIANETWRLFPYRLGIVWRIDATGRPRLDTVSGLAQLPGDTPMSVWLARLGQALAARIHDPAAIVSVDELPQDLRDGWQEWLTGHLYVQRVIDREGQGLAIAAFDVEDGPAEQAQTLANRLFAAYGHAWSALGPRRRRWPGAVSSRRWLPIAALALMVAALFIPVRLSVLAPAEVVALEAIAVSAPLDGVIGGFHVRPNQPVTAGTPLFSLEPTTLRNRREVLAQQLQVAKAEALATAQKSFDHEASRADLAALQGRVRERQAELAGVDEQFGRLQVRAPADGVVVFGDVNDWQGKPVVTGERIALVADPKDAGLLIWLPVADAIALEPGSPVRVFLQIAPLSPLPATLWQTSYQALASPDGTQAYRLRARFEPLTDEQRRLARIGLRGTAKIQGDRAALGYYLLRRPLATLREWSGL